MTTLRQATSLWRKLAKARGILSEVLNELPPEKHFYGDLKRDIRKVLKETAARPPDDLDMEAYRSFQDRPRRKRPGARRRGKA